MESLQSPNQVFDLPPEPLGNAHIQVLATIFGDSTELGQDLLLAESIILKLLSGPCHVHM